MKALSLFSGIGGLDLAAQTCGIQTVAFCEIAPFAQSILEKRFPGVPICADIRSMKGDEFGSVDVVFGGFPCQDLSVAGKKAGLEGERSGLWFEMLRIVREIRPRYVLAENVRGAINLALDTATAGLEGAGYEVRTSLVPASLFGAPHQRYRIFILGVRRDVADALADVSRERLERACEHGALSEQGAQSDDRNAVGGGASLWRTPDANAGRGANSEQTYRKRKAAGMPLTLNTQVAHEERRWSTPQASDSSQGAVIGKGDTFKRLPSGRLRKINKNGVDGSVGLAREVVLDNGQAAPIVTADNAVKGQLNPAWVEQLMGYPDGWTDPDCDEPGPWIGWPARPGEEQHAFEHPRTVVGMPNRAKRLKALGNSVVPQQAEPIFRTIEIIERSLRYD